jgi:hypothetical protein
VIENLAVEKQSVPVYQVQIFGGFTASIRDADIFKVHFVVFNLGISCARIAREGERGLCILILGLHFMLTALEFVISRVCFFETSQRIKI